jgi:quercetin dioxygenase-like cupin family protein
VQETVLNLEMILMSNLEELKAATVFPMGEENKMFEKYFLGKSYLNLLTMERIVIGNVTFEPGCRNNWHIHHKGGQVLLCTAGRGYYQEFGKAPQELHAGDVVNIPPEVRHWHGAAPDSWFAHLAIEVPSEGSSNEWLEQVSDEEYGKLK